jgi:hypothetical protein
LRGPRDVTMEDRLAWIRESLRWRGLAAIVLYRPVLSSERIATDSYKNLVIGLAPRQSSRLTVGSNIDYGLLDLNSVQSLESTVRLIERVAEYRDSRQP